MKKLKKLRLSEIDLNPGNKLTSENMQELEGGAGCICNDNPFKINSGCVCDANPFGICKCVGNSTPIFN